MTLQNDGNIRGFATVQAIYTGSTKTLTVTVASKTAAHRYNGTGSSNGYKIDGYEAPFITLTPGRTYRFDQADSTNSGHPLRFYLEADKTTAYTTGVTTNGTAGTSGAYTEIAVTDTTPIVLHYQCSAHGHMGNSVSSNSNVVNYNDLLNKPTIPTNNNQLTNGANYIDGSALNATNLSSGTIPDARFPSTLPAISGANLTNLPSTGGLVGGGSEQLFVEGENQMDNSFATLANFNYIAASPMTIASGATLTVSANSTMTFV